MGEVEFFLFDEKIEHAWFVSFFSNTMNQTVTLCNALFGTRHTKWEINASNAHQKVRDGYMRDFTLKQAVRTRKITQHQANWVTQVWLQTICYTHSNWSTSVATAIHKHSATLRKHIVAELRTQGSKQYSRKVVSGCVYYDCSSESALEYLAKIVYDSTCLFKTQIKNKNLKPLSFEETNDRAVIKALVYGLFTRPRMCAWIKTDIQDGAIVDASPRCISESTWHEIQRRQELYSIQQNAEMVRKQNRAKFMTWAHGFIAHFRLPTLDDWDAE